MFVEKGQGVICTKQCSAALEDILDKNVYIILTIPSIQFVCVSNTIATHLSHR